MSQFQRQGDMAVDIIIIISVMKTLTAAIFRDIVFSFGEFISTDNSYEYAKFGGDQTNKSTRC